MTHLCPARAIGHLTTPGYRAGNSIDGNRHAKRHGIQWVDNDWQVTRDHHDLNTHWAKPARERFLPTFGDRHWSNLTWPQVQTMKTPDGYRVRDMHQAFIDAKWHGQNVEVEAKFQCTADDCLRLADLARDVFGDQWQARVWVKTLSTLPGGYPAAVQRLHAAKVAGFTTLLLARGTDVRRRTFPAHIDYVRGVLQAPIQPKEIPVTYPAPSPKYLGPAAKHGDTDGNKPIGRIVIHSTVSPCEPGGARNIAAYFRSSKAGGSAHYVVDPSEVVQVVYDSTVAFHAPPNTHSLGIEMCDVPGPRPDDKPGTARYMSLKRAWRWAKPNQKAMLARTARLTAELCLAYDVPPYFVNAKGLKAGKRGVTTHAQVSAAFHLSTHWDPGWWPRLTFMRMVRAEVAKIKAGA